MVYRGIRKRNISEIGRVNTLIKAKLEAKIAKTAALLTGALVFSFLPAVVLFSLGEVFPFFHTSTYFLLWETLIQLNSLVNPLLYCCRDRRFRNAVLELLRIRKPPVGHPRTVGAVRYVRRMNSLGVCTVKDTSEPPNASRPSCGPAVALGRSWSRNLSRVNVYTIPVRSHTWWHGTNLPDFPLQKASSFIPLETVTIRGESGRFAWPNDVNLDLGSASITLVIHQNRNTAILKHSVNFAESCPNGRQTILYLLITASCVIHTRINILTTLTFEGNTWKILSYCLLNPAWNLPESQQFDRTCAKRYQNIYHS